MCNRAATYPNKRITEHLKGHKVFDYPEYHQVSAFNHYPLPVIKSDAPDIIQPVQWGMKPYWHPPGTPFAVLQKEEGQTINTQAEHAFKWLPKFGHLKKQERCIILVKGFFEFRHEEPGKPKTEKTPYFVYMPDDLPMAIPSVLWSWVNEDSGELIETVSMLTTSANERLSYIHNTKLRMPAIIDQADWAQWLDPNWKYVAPKPYSDGVMKDHAVANFLKKGMDQNCPEVQYPKEPAQAGLF